MIKEHAVRVRSTRLESITRNISARQLRNADRGLQNVGIRGVRLSGEAATQHSLEGRSPRNGQHRSAEGASKCVLRFYLRADTFNGSQPIFIARFQR